MNDGFNVNEYWLDRGLNYLREALPQDFHRLQEQFLIDNLRASRIPMDKILELGCGFGRITRVLAESFPKARITALDLSTEQLKNAQQHCGDNPNISFQAYDFYSTEPFPGGVYDTVVAIEVFLHHPLPVVRNLFEKLSAVSRHIVNIDWSEDWPWKTPEHVWVHDYPSIYAHAGLRCATFVLPRKIEGLQQKLFIAGHELSPALLNLEHKLQTAVLHTSNSAADLSALPEAARWPQQLDLALQELQRALPTGSAFILVNDDQWGAEARALSGYRVFPFLERGGQYWGPPADDRAALRELERLRQEGASFIVFAWSSFWWLDYYPGLYEHVRSVCSPVLENERLKIFRLPT